MTRIQTETNPLAFIDVDMTASRTAARPAYLMFDPKQWDDPDATPLTVSLSYDSDRRSMPEDVWHGRILRWSMPLVNAVEFTAAINGGALDADLAAIAAGHTVAWNGSNHVGRLTEDAALAVDAVAAYLAGWEPLEGGVWDAGDWLGDYGYHDIATDYGLNPATATDADIARIATEIDADAEREHLVILHGTENWLRDHRDAARADP